MTVPGSQSPVLWWSISIASAAGRAGMRARGGERLRVCGASFGGRGRLVVPGKVAVMTRGGCTTGGVASGDGVATGGVTTGDAATVESRSSGHVPQLLASAAATLSLLWKCS